MNEYRPPALKMETLPNGAIVIDSKVIGPDRRRFVLCIARRDEHGTEYVVWRIDDLGNCSSGSYWPDLIHAVGHFASRTN